MPMPTLNVCVQVYMNKKTQHLLKLQLYTYIYIYIYFIYLKIYSYIAILFSSNSLLIDKLNLKISVKMLIQIGLIHLFCSPYLPKDSYRISIFVFPFF